MKIMKNDIEKFIVSEYQGPLDYQSIFERFIIKYNIENMDEYLSYHIQN